jgi:hypothetical protein
VTLIQLDYQSIVGCPLTLFVNQSYNHQNIVLDRVRAPAVVPQEAALLLLFPLILLLRRAVAE